MAERNLLLWNDVLNALPVVDGRWLDRQSPQLTYQVARFLIPQIEDEAAWTTRKVEFEFAKAYRGGFMGEDLTDAALSVTSGLAQRGLLTGRNGCDLRNVTRNTPFRIKEEPVFIGDAYLYMAILAERANKDAQVIEDHIHSAHYFSSLEQ